MQWGSSKQTEIYFFSSVRAGSGKSTIVSNLAIYLDSLNYRVAILDFDYTAPRKILDTIPRTIVVKEYQDLATLTLSNTSRFQANEYFKEINKLSYLPAHQLRTPSKLMSDTSLRDFFLQMVGVFDYIIINLAPGLNETENVSDMLSKSYLWRGCKPSSLIISLTDEKSLITFDTFIQTNQVISYQAEENTYFIFNRVPNTTDNQNLNETLLNVSDIRSIFTYPLVYVIPYIDEFIKQESSFSVFVLQKDSFINQHIVGLVRILNGYASISFLMRETSSYHSCISGTLLSRIYPYLEKIQQKVANKLFINPADVNIYVEQNEDNFRIRVRLTSVSQKSIRIRSDIPDYQAIKTSFSQDTAYFDYVRLNNKLKIADQLERETPYALSLKSVYTFDDSFYSQPITNIQPILPIVPTKDSYPSPILFGYIHRISEIPTLSNILGLVGERKALKFSEYNAESYNYSIQPFYIPTEFNLRFFLDSNFKTDYKANFSNICYSVLSENDISLVSAYEYTSKKTYEYKLYENFEKKPIFQFVLSDFIIIANQSKCDTLGIELLPSGKFSLYDDSLADINNKYIPYRDNTSVVKDITLKRFKLQFNDGRYLSYKFDWNADDVKYTVLSPSGYEHNKAISSYDKYRIKDFELIFFSDNISNFIIDEKQKRINIENLLKLNILEDKTVIDILKFGILNSELDILKEDFSSKSFKSLPNVINTDDLMLEYDYKVEIIDNNKEMLFDNKNSDGDIYQPDLRCVFENNYTEPDLIMRATYQKPIIYQLFKQGKLRVSNKILVSNIDYKIAYHEVFPTINIPKITGMTLVKKEEETIDQYLDININKSKELRLKINPLSIIIDDNKNFENVFVALKFKVYPDKFNQFLKTIKYSLRFFSPKKPDFIENYLKYIELPVLGTEIIKEISVSKSFEIVDDSCLSINSIIPPDVAPPNLYIDKMRQKTEKFISYGFKEPQINIIKFKPFISMKKQLVLPTFVHHKTKVELEEYTSVDIPKIPTRIRSLKLINNFTNLNKHKPSYDFTFNYSLLNICFSKDKENFFENSFIYKKFMPQYHDAKITSHYILKKVAGKIPSPNLNTKRFFVVGEKAIDILYKHMLWQFKNTFNKILCDFNEKLLKIESSKYDSHFKDSFNFMPIPDNVNFRFSDGIIKIKSNDKEKRKTYRIRVNHIKDLLAALAKSKVTGYTNTQDYM